MRRRLHRFAVVGLVATTIDIAGFVVLYRAGWPLVVADIVVLNVAAVVAWTLHRVVTLQDDPFIRWIGSPGVFGAMVVVAGAVDLSVLMLAGAGTTTRSALLAKTAAVAAAAVVRAAAYRSLIFRSIRREQDQPTCRPGPGGSVRVSVVIPAFREADRIGTTIDRIRAELGPLVDDDLEIVVVDDGSEAGGAADRVITLPANRGKGGALRAGVLAATGRTVAFTDADLAYAPDQIADLLALVEAGFDWVVGSRRHVDTLTVVKAGRLREVGGRLVNLATRILLLGRYRDTQCGLKACRADVARVLFSSSSIDGFALDVELFHLAERWRLSLAEVPVQVEHSERSTVHVVRDGLRLVRDLFAVRRRARRGDYPADPGLPAPA